MAEKKSIEFEREYVIPLRDKVMKVPRYKRAKKAIRVIKEFLAQHMQVRDRDLKKIRLDKYLNMIVWERGIQTPPHKIKVRARKEGELVRVEAYELPSELKFKKQKEEKRNTSEKKEKPKKAEEKVKEDAEAKTGDEQKAKEEKEKKSTTIDAEQKYEKQKAKEMKHQGKTDKRPIQTKKEHSKGKEGVH